MKTNQERWSEIPIEDKAELILQHKNEVAQELGYLNHSHREKSEKAQQAIIDSKKLIIDWEEEAKRQSKNSK